MARPRETTIEIEEVTERQAHAQIRETYSKPEATLKFFGTYVSRKQEALKALRGNGLIPRKREEPCFWAADSGGVSAPRPDRNRKRTFACVLVALAILALGALAAPTASAARCSKTYSYAGLVSARSAHGVGTTLKALAVPGVNWGHVAGWVGVGGVGAGPRGATEWIQVGYAGFYGGETKLYYEITEPGSQPRFTEVDSQVLPGESHRVAVAEMPGRRNWWRVWVDRRPVSAPVYLPGSHGTWQPMATAESWNAGMGACNRFAYRFSGLRIAGRPGHWRRFSVGYELEDHGYRVSRFPAGFVARAR